MINDISVLETVIFVKKLLSFVGNKQSIKGKVGDDAMDK